MEEKKEQVAKEGVIRMGNPIINADSFLKTTQEFVEDALPKEEKEKTNLNKLLKTSKESRKLFSAMERNMCNVYRDEIKRIKDSAEIDIQKGRVEREYCASLFPPMETLVDAYEQSLDSPFSDLTVTLGLLLTILLKFPKEFRILIKLMEDFTSDVLIQKLKKRGLEEND